MLQKPEDIIQERFLEAVNSLKSRFPNKLIVEKTGYKSGIVSEYLRGIKPVSEKFLRVFCEKFGFDFDYLMANKPVPAGDKRAGEVAIIKALIFEAATAKVEVSELKNEIEKIKNALLAIKGEKPPKAKSHSISFDNAVEEIVKNTRLVKDLELDIGI